MEKRRWIEIKRRRRFPKGALPFFFLLGFLKDLPSFPPQGERPKQQKVVRIILPWTMRKLTSPFLPVLPPPPFRLFSFVVSFLNERRVYSWKCRNFCVFVWNIFAFRREHLECSGFHFTVVITLGWKFERSWAFEHLRKDFVSMFSDVLYKEVWH